MVKKSHEGNAGKDKSADDAGCSQKAVQDKLSNQPDSRNVATDVTMKEYSVGSNRNYGSDDDDGVMMTSENRLRTISPSKTYITLVIKKKKKLHGMQSQRIFDNTDDDF